MSRCNNFPCALDAGHTGPCQSWDRDQFPDDDEPRDDDPYCDCGVIHDEEEMGSGRCSCCGKLVPQW